MIPPSAETAAERERLALRMLVELRPPPGRAWLFDRRDGALRAHSRDLSDAAGLKTWGSA